MEELFALKNIGLQKIIYEQEVEDDIEFNYAYTRDLLNKNILIKFYEELSDNSDTIQTTISAISITETTYCIFQLFIDDFMLQPIQAFRMVADIIEFIESRGAETILSDLEKISTNAGKFNINSQVSAIKEDVQTFNRVLEMANESLRNKDSGI